MYNKKYNLLVVSFLFLFVMMSFVSAVKPISNINLGDTGLIIEPTIKDYLKTSGDHEFEIHVFNASNGHPVITGITCYMHLYHEDGDHVFEGEDATANPIFDYSFDLNGTNFTSRGEYQAKFQCNNSVEGGASEIFFVVNDYGEELTEANSSMFNFSMVFLMIFFVLALIGLFITDNYIGKFALYWVTHVLFIISTFSVWQFTSGYAISFVGLAGVWKIMFYVGIGAVLPMILLSMAWVFYIHAFNEHFQKLVDKGNDTETAFKMANKKSGGWFGGQSRGR